MNTVFLAWYCFSSQMWLMKKQGPPRACQHWSTSSSHRHKCGLFPLGLSQVNWSKMIPQRPSGTMQSTVPHGGSVDGWLIDKDWISVPNGVVFPLHCCTQHWLLMVFIFSLFYILYCICSVCMCWGVHKSEEWAKATRLAVGPFLPSHLLTCPTHSPKERSETSDEIFSCCSGPEKIFLSFKYS